MSTTVKYHDIFDYKLTKAEAYKWQYKNEKVKVTGKKNKQRLQRERYSKKKLLIAKKAARLISVVPFVKFVGITGSLAMMNAKKESDIDLLIITKSGLLWTTRLLVYLVLKLSSFKLRNPKNSFEQDMLCLNMWIDESDLEWSKKDRNLYTAHEIAQIVPLVNKKNTYEKFLRCNRWLLNYWPNSVQIDSKKVLESKSIEYKNSIVEKLFFNLEYMYMQDKITTETITSTRAFFHPIDGSFLILKKLSS